MVVVLTLERMKTYWLYIPTAIETARVLTIDENNLHKLGETPPL